MTGIIGRKKIKNIQKEEDNLFHPRTHAGQIRVAGFFNLFFIKKI
jgi:hypothetical protein